MVATKTLQLSGSMAVKATTTDIGFCEEPISARNCQNEAHLDRFKTCAFPPSLSSVSMSVVLLLSSNNYKSIPTNSQRTTNRQCLLPNCNSRSRGALAFWSCSQRRCDKMPPNCTQGPSEEDWERHKSDIHQKYLIQRKPVKDLIGEMSRRGYRVTCVVSFFFSSFDACYTNTWPQRNHRWRRD